MQQTRVIVRPLACVNKITVVCAQRSLRTGLSSRRKKNQAMMADTAQEKPGKSALVKASDPRNVASSTKTFA